MQTLNKNDSLFALMILCTAFLAFLFLGTGCAVLPEGGGSALPADDELPVDELDEQPTAPLDVAGELGEPDCGDDQQPEQPEPDPILSLPFPRCLGHWADNSDSSTRYTEHPDTGLCTFACVWEEPRCQEDWYGDSRCFPAHAAVLGQLCAELGGSCELNDARTNRYCVVTP